MGIKRETLSILAATLEPMWLFNVTYSRYWEDWIVAKGAAS